MLLFLETQKDERTQTANYRPTGNTLLHNINSRQLSAAHLATHDDSQDGNVTSNHNFQYDTYMIQIYDKY